MERTGRTDELRVMPWWLALVGLLVALGAGWLVLDLLLAEADRAAAPDTRAGLRIDAIRTGLTVVVGTGGGMAFLLAARRQWLTEGAQRHQETVAAHDRAHRDRVQTHAEAVAEATGRQQESQADTAEHDATERPRFGRALAMDHVEFFGYAGFRLVGFADLALFRWAVFGRDAHFERASFDGPANFERASFDGPANFGRARFGRAPLRRRGSARRVTRVGPVGLVRLAWSPSGRLPRTR
ncbi:MULTISPECIES: pentapeptide repeat-containing protein [Micromonospora]|uniref:Pentapeptide repeat-containing protein n=1 Tax=Micromonospora yangpuensis TaxID=683228 RepID=A0A1C6UZ38_9ACTN|nr:pentapeptide repeat-containing protein [Micromonospora yangpuensis]GGL95970.1 hypothetical protein GCM10012279_11730 [Micromonospora yangpuensis]SCL59328.1 Pentapeptide repeat-containing protein [Micromonospora yangpuensis]